MEAFFCATKQIVKCHAQNASKGMMSFEINEDPNFVASLNSTGVAKPAPGNQRPLTKLMLSNIQIDGVNGLCRILEAALTGKPLP